MWTHSRKKTSRFGGNSDADANNSGLRDRIEKSLDLTQYLQYLDTLFSERSIASESESSDNDDDSPAFTKFRQPPSAQSQERSRFQYCQSSNNQLTSFSPLKSSDSLHSEASISSSSSLSSVESSGSSSLSLSLTSDFHPVIPLKRGSRTSTEKSTSSSSTKYPESSSSTPCTDDDKPEDKSKRRPKKPQKKKKVGGEDSSKQNKPRSDGNGRGGSEGGGGSGSGGSSVSTASTSNNLTSTNSSDGGGTSKKGSVKGSSSGAKSRSSTESIQQDESLEVMDSTLALPSDEFSQDCIQDGSDYQSSFDATEEHLNSIISNADDLLLNGDLTDNFSSDFLMGRTSDVFDSNTISSFPLPMLDLSEDENILNHFISATASINTQPKSSSPQPQPIQKQLSTKPPGKGKPSTVSSEQSQNSSKACDKKRKYDSVSGKEAPCSKIAKLTDKQKQSRIEYFNAKRKKIYLYICRKEIGKTQRNMASTFKESLAMKRKLAQACERHQRKEAQQSEKCMKESVSKAKKLTQEMELYWKLADKTERDFLRAKEKEAEEIQKQELEILKKKVQDLKSHRLVSLIELFSCKIRRCSESEEMEILSNLVDVKEDKRLAKFINLDSEVVMRNVEITAERALNEHQNLVKILDANGFFPSEFAQKKEIGQPHIFEGILREFQIKGMNWINDLYVQGLNGILSDEAGLGKRIQVAAFLSHLVESGGFPPFLIVCPSAVLCKWRKVFETMSPSVKVVLYSGKPMEKNTLEQLIDQNLGSISIDVVITSYQAMVSDLKYFSQIHWQYLIMDDSQGVITSSTKWITLLSFRCRNKLLLTDFSRINSSSNLCPYLYFIMPSLFDSHEELSEWLLQELGSTTPKKCKNIDEKFLKRLRTVIQKFLLRRSKLEVDLDTEIDCKVDVQVFCPLSYRQQRIYSNLLKETNVRLSLETLNKCSMEERRNVIKNLLNLSMQLLKTCNHPDLVSKRKDERLSLWMSSKTLVVPQSIWTSDDSANKSSADILRRYFCIYNSSEIYKSVFDGGNNLRKNVTKNISTWNFIRFIELSFSEVEEIFRQPNHSRLNHLVTFQSMMERMIFESTWKSYGCERANLMQYPSIRLYYLLRSKIIEPLLFTSFSSLMYTWGTCKISGTANNIEYRSLQSRNILQKIEGGKRSIGSNSTVKKNLIRSFQQLDMPQFLLCCTPKVISKGFRLNFVPQCVKNSSKRQNISTNCFESGLVTDETVPKAWRKLLVNISFSTSLQGNTYQNQLIMDSGKFRRLNQLLSSLMVNHNRVLLCSYSPDTLDLLEEFLTIRKLEHVRVEEGATGWKNETFVFTLLTPKWTPKVPVIPADTIVLFDQDWTANYDEREKIIRKLVRPGRVNYYLLTSEGTIEERLSKEMKNTLIASNNSDTGYLALSTLATAVICEFNLGKPKHTIKHVVNEVLPGKNNETARGLIVRGESSGVYLKEKFDVCDKHNSASTIGNKEETEEGRRIRTGDPFEFSFDEDNMDMSPDSFDDIIKSDYEDDSSPGKYKTGRGTGKRGRPPSRARLQRRDTGDGSPRRGPGRPRLKPIGPANQGLRGRKPGRPPLNKKAETIAASLASLASGQRVFGFYNSSNFEFS